MEVGITVHAENPLTGERQLTTSALLTFVALDAAGKKMPVPALAIENGVERLAAEEATNRRTERLARKNKGGAWLTLIEK